MRHAVRGYGLWQIVVVCSEGVRMILTIYGATIVTLMMLFYAFESRSHWFTLAFAIACLGSAAYGFLAGTWPFGVVESIWSLVALRKWQVVRLR
ncbi:conserved protein of unknown function [Acidithiobacillus ferrivorans]|uniref:Uncharacterized protein n=2 Tax=Acidithiobacillus ferrivorans TaxID=160808 RepID=A0A060V051_9PROT|nr:conserved hypothetical protein [Acidithiobacillus ferrivorans]SMH65173.1 conserved protein of unknown function [Acidithiobacillus ferrivorans]